MKFIRQSAAGGVVMKIERGKEYVLLIEDSYGHWTWPKGHIEKGESPEDAALREIREETGLKKLKLVEKIGNQEYFFVFNGEKIFKTVHIFLVKAAPGEKLTAQTSEIRVAKWFSPRGAVKKIEYENSDKLLKNGIEMFSRARSRERAER